MDLTQDLKAEWWETHRAYSSAVAHRDGTRIKSSTRFTFGKHTIVEWIELCVRREGAEAFLADCASFGRLDWTNEALVLRYAELFDDEIVAVSARRLAPHHRALTQAPALVPA